MKAAAVILAGGNGTRFGADTPKQFVNLNGKPIYLHAVEAFSTHPDIEEVVLVLPKDGAQLEWNSNVKMPRIVYGGATRRESSYNGLSALSGELRHVLIHDAARPLVSHDVITRCINALNTCFAVDVTIESPDTIVELMEKHNEVRKIPNRSGYRLGQTPQAFDLQMILDAHKNATGEFTDDLGIFMQRYPVASVANVQGEERNMKITTQADLIKAERLARAVPEQETDLPAGKALVYGGTGGIGSEVVLWLQSDARHDVGIWNREDCRLASNHEALYHVEKHSLDYLVISTGTLKEAHPDTDWNEWDDEFDNNFTHIARFLGTVKRRGIMKQGGSIVVVGSSSAYQGRGTYTAYSAAKAALVNFVQGFADEWPDVRLNIVNPARTATAMRRKMFPNEEGVLLDPKEVGLRIVRVLGMPCTGCVFDVRANGIDV